MHLIFNLLFTHWGDFEKSSWISFFASGSCTEVLPPSERRKAQMAHEPSVHAPFNCFLTFISLRLNCYSMFCCFSLLWICKAYIARFSRLYRQSESSSCELLSACRKRCKFRRVGNPTRWGDFEKSSWISFSCERVPYNGTAPEQKTESANAAWTLGSCGINCFQAYSLVTIKLLSRFLLFSLILNK